MSDEAKPGWRKSKDKWVICGPANVMKPGEVVDVFRKDGSSSKIVISSNPEDLGKPFDDEYSNTKMVYAYKFEEVKDQSEG